MNQYLFKLDSFIEAIVLFTFFLTSFFSDNFIIDNFPKKVIFSRLIANVEKKNVIR